MVLRQVNLSRQLHPVMGGRKLYCLLQSFLAEHQIKMGRDALFDLLAANGLLVKKRKRRIATTQSFHWLKKYPNLIKDWHPGKPRQLWVADITYVPVSNGFLYLSLITDAYSHKIMGYSIAENLSAIHTIKALEMALTDDTGPRTELIHHSDRGMQYCSTEYTNLLKTNQITISMTESGDPLENAVAERINGIIKEEYLQHYEVTTCQEAQDILEAVIERYNTQRPHTSINMLTPATVHQLALPVNRTWSKKQSLNIAKQYQG